MTAVSENDKVSVKVEACSGTITVLHVAEALGGGLMSALKDYITNSPEHVHHVVLAHRRPGHDTGDFSNVPVIDLGSLKSPIRTALRILRVVREVQPDVVHVHSSWAGFVCRLLPLSRDRIVYTPHCYAFEREDVKPIVRRAYLLAERVLASRTGVVAAVSPREAELSKRLRPNQEVHYIPNIATARPASPAQSVPSPRSEATIVTTGRIMAQKDPGWFLAFAEKLEELNPKIHLKWLGGGEETDEAALRRAGVEVTGWIDRDRLLEELARASVYVHTAAWEGAPLSVFEAAAAGVPVFARRIESLESLAAPFLFNSPSDMAEAVVHAVATEAGHEDAVRRTRTFSWRHTPKTQTRALAALYTRFGATPGALSPATSTDSNVALLEVLPRLTPAQPVRPATLNAPSPAKAEVVAS